MHGRDGHDWHDSIHARLPAPRTWNVGLWRGLSGEKTQVLPNVSERQRRQCSARVPPAYVNTMQFALLQGATQGSGLTDRLWLDRSWRRPTILLWDYPSAAKTAHWMGQEVLEEPPQPPSPVGVSLCRSPHQSPQHQSPPRCFLNTSSDSHSAFITADTRPTFRVAADTRPASNVQPSTRSLHYPSTIYKSTPFRVLSSQLSPTTSFCPTLHGRYGFNREAPS